MFLNLLGAAEGALIRAAASTQPFGGFEALVANEWRIVIFGLNIIFIGPSLFLILLAITVGTWRYSKRGAKPAITSVVRIVVYGGFALFILFILLLGMYYAGGGH